jgi:NAD(P)-dependent dehydrogenase (short-subunit alcohol dehydrogenase family)
MPRRTEDRHVVRIGLELVVAFCLSISTPFISTSYLLSSKVTGYVTHWDMMESLFRLDGQVAVVTGGSGALGRLMCEGLAGAGASVAVIARSADRVDEVVEAIGTTGGEAMAAPADALERAQLTRVRDAVLERWGRIDILVNGAGGNVAEATLAPDGSLFDLPTDAFRQVFDLNLMGTVLPTQVFGEVMAKQRRGVVVNISSMAADRAITRVVGYSAAKASVENFTRWMAVEMARSYGAGLRVNALAPGFFVGEQNRRLLLEDDGSLTPRGMTIIAHTPMGRFGEPAELIGTLLWLCSDASRFVTGIVVPVDGGFSAFSGV